MTDKQGYTLLMMIATLVAQIEPVETTRAFNKLRRNIRIGLQKYQRRVGLSAYQRQLEYANKIWESAKQDLENPDDFTVAISLSMTIVYDLLDEPYKNMWFSEKIFDRAIRSIEHNYEAQANVEKNSQWLVDRFREKLDLPSKDLSKLQLYIKIQKDNQLL